MESNLQSKKGNFSVNLRTNKQTHSHKHIEDKVQKEYCKKIKLQEECGKKSREREKAMKNIGTTRHFKKSYAKVYRNE